ncbi:MAG: D-2-hydroxyacid dehydrogenase [Pseudomonadota bacterium]
MNKKIKMAIISRDHDVYASLYYAHQFENAELIRCSDTPSAETLENAEVILCEPDVAETFLLKCSALKWLQSTWAGNNALQRCDKKDYLLTGVKEIFHDQIKEYVFAFILSYYRQLDTFKQLKDKKHWKPVPGNRIKGLTLGVLGFGSVAQALIDAANVFGLNIIGLTNNGGLNSETKCLPSEERLLFASQSDIVVNLLPDTEKTRGLCDTAFFEHMREGSLFINAGRGSVIDAPSTLIQALDNEVIGAAVLDVFETEPLPSNHAFYHHPKITITNHSAAISKPEDVFQIFLENYERYIHRQSLLYVHDFDKGY